MIVLEIYHSSTKNKFHQHIRSANDIISCTVVLTNLGDSTDVFCRTYAIVATSLCISRSCSAVNVLCIGFSSYFSSSLWFTGGVPTRAIQCTVHCHQIRFASQHAVPQNHTVAQWCSPHSDSQPQHHSVLSSLYFQSILWRECDMVRQKNVWRLTT